ncbi:hypothetical protein Tco_0913195 [Tanacetum coccineum]
MPTHEIGLRNPYLIWDLCWGAHKADECGQRILTEQGNCQQKGEKESDPKWVIKSKFEDEFAGFMLGKKFHIKGIRETLDQHRKEIHEIFSHILTTIEENKILESGALTFAITTRSGASTRDPLFLNSSQTTTTDQNEGTIEGEGSESEVPGTF